MKRNKLTASKLQEILGCSAVKVNKGVYTIGRSYYYRPCSLTSWTGRVKEYLAAIETHHGYKFEVINFGDKFRPFKGGQNVWQGSHFWLTCKIV